MTDSTQLNSTLFRLDTKSKAKDGEMKNKDGEIKKKQTFAAIHMIYALASLIALWIILALLIAVLY